MHPLLVRILDDLAPSRLFAAFEGRNAPCATPRPLFDLCLRATVPFGVVDGILQASLPHPFCRLVLVPLARSAPVKRHSPAAVTAGEQNDNDNTGRGAASRRVSSGNNNRDGDDRYVIDDDDDDDGRQQPHPPEWVSCCGCPARPRAADALDEPTAVDDRCNGTPPCPRGWLRRINRREALRIAAWHWACVVADNVHGPEAYGPPERPSCGFCETDWERAAGLGVRWHFRPTSSTPVADTDASGIYFHDSYGGRLTAFSIAACDTAIVQRQFASSTDSRFAVHPSWPRVRVRIDYAYGVPLCLAVSVAGDPLFVGYKEI
nr:hypothetical protein [Pandoravirus massiliensis]